MERYFAIYKPYKMLSQFVRMPKKRCLADLDFEFPSGANALGRLDENSEGLLLISNDKKLNLKLLKPENEHKRVYWVQVQWKVTQEALKKMEEGILIRLEKGAYLTRPCKVKVIDTPLHLPARERRPVKAELDTCWLEMELTEGKFHQVRKMCAGINHQVLRLIRVSIEDLKLPEYTPGKVTELYRDEVYSLLKIPPDKEG